MKKIFGILGVAIIAATMFFSANNLDGSNLDISLAGLMNINVAHSEDGVNTAIYWEEENDCMIPNPNGTYRLGTYISCPAGKEDCNPKECS